MKRLLFGFGAGLIIAMASVTGILIQPTSAQNVDDFTINRFDADYYLDKDNEGRSTLKTVERITATFPAFDQNHGLERALPETYDDHSTNLQVESVTDNEGQALPYSDSQSDDNIVLRIGDADTYVHGAQTYVITYTQRDVTRFFGDTNADEFYWDVSGTGWKQSMDLVSARIHMPASLSKRFNQNASCYQGVEGSTTTCPITPQITDSETVFSVQGENLYARENITFAIGFTPNTFAAYRPTWQERMLAEVLAMWVVLFVIGSIIAIVMLVLMGVRYYKLMRRAKGRGTIIPEYLPPKGTSVLVSAQILKNTTSDVTAQLIDLAVRHYLKIYQTKEKTLFKLPEYELEIVRDIDDLQKEEQRLLKDLFGSTGVTPGSRFAMATLRRKYTLNTKLTASRKEVQKSARNEYALYECAETDAKHFKVVGFILLTAGILTLSPVLIIVAIVAFVLANLSWPLSEKGAELRDYLKGLKLYISVAEEDRIKMLQSPEGAEKVGEQIDGDDSSQLVKLYERVLPYAVLFDIEKEWTKQLSVYYETTGGQPDWYVGNGVFNAVVFASALGSFTSQSSSYSSPSSSSFGGSGGGGFSGGGGGGGGGGGW